MKKKNSAVPSTAPRLIGADPIREFTRMFPKEATVLGAKGSRSANLSVIFFAYSLNGSVYNASFSAKGGDV